MRITYLLNRTYLLILCCQAMPHRDPNPINKYFIYSFSKNTTLENKRVIEMAMKEYAEYTCIIFLEKHKYDGIHQKFVMAPSLGGRCDYFRGDVEGNGTLKLAPDCMTSHTILHEIAHALGFEHEHTRKDRGPFIKVFEKRIISNAYKNKLAINPGLDGLTVPYDYLSVMHYGSYEKYGPHEGVHNPLPVMKSLDPSYNKQIAVGANLSFYDIMSVNKLYNCDKHCPVPDRCPVNSYRGKDCKCYCSNIARKLSDPQWYPSLSFAKRMAMFFRQTPLRENAVRGDETAQIECQPPKSECEDRWLFRYKDNCYIFINEHLGWEQASERCLALGGRIVTPRSKAENIYITNKIIKKSIPYSKRQLRRVWINAKFEKARGAWTIQDTGEELIDDHFAKVYTNFYPQRSYTPKNCLLMPFKRKWVDEPCNGSKSHPSLICKKKTMSAVVCEDGWSRLSDHCYKRQSNIKLTWQQAYSDCERMDASLTDSTSSHENTFLTQMLPSGSSNYGWLNAKNENWKREGFGITTWRWADTDKKITRGRFLRKDWRKNTDSVACLMLHRDGWWVGSSCQLNNSAICKKRLSLGGMRLGQHNIIGCPNDNINIKCDPWGVIKIRSVNFLLSYFDVSHECNDKSKCVLPVNNDLIKTVDNSCPGTSKYMLVDFDCVQKNDMHPDCPMVKADRNNPNRYFRKESDTSHKNPYWKSRRCATGDVFWPEGCGCYKPKGDHASHGEVPVTPTAPLLFSIAALIVF